MNLKKQFSYLVYHHRTNLGMTQEYVAEMVGISTRSVQYIEKGQWVPARETMLKLMIVLQIDPCELAEEVGIDVSLLRDHRTTHV